MKLFNPDTIIIHHSLTKDGSTVNWQAIRRYHMDEMRWIEIGCNYGIELIGTQYEILLGRFEGTIGAHTIGHNIHSIGICFVGNFDEDYPDMAQWNKGVELCANIALRCAIPSANIKGHNDYAPYKSCPGKRFDMDLFRNDVSAILI